MLGYSSILKNNANYYKNAKTLFTALKQHREDYCFFDGAKDIWARDYMPLKNKSGKYISFKYDPTYLKNHEDIKTNFKIDVSPFLKLSVIYSDINLDGGNVVFSPSKEKAVISDRVFLENSDYDRTALIKDLEDLLETEVIIIPSLESDLTGHADGMIRFINETTVLGNATPYKNGLEQRIKKELNIHGISVIDFPYFYSQGISAVGCYLNFLETQKHIFLPMFDVEMDREAIATAKNIWKKQIVPINCCVIAKAGGALNCISCEL